jgi:hypothetical protein
VPIAYRESFVLDAGHHPYPREAAQRQALAEILGAFFREL